MADATTDSTTAANNVEKENIVRRQRGVAEFAERVAKEWVPTTESDLRNMVSVCGDIYTVLDSSWSLAQH